MEISTEIGSFKRYGDNFEILRLLKDSGFTAYDFSMFRGTKERLIDSEDFKRRGEELRAYADKIGIKCNQAHAPFPSAIKGNEEYNKQIFPEIARAIELSGILGAKVCVVHPYNEYTAEENAVLYKRFEPYARKAGVKIGVENMWDWDDKEGHACAAACSCPDDYEKHFSLLDKDVFVACLDIGHAEMRGLNTSAPQMIFALKDKLQAIHLHDNDCWHDSHMLPYTMSIDFQAIISALKEIGYKGDITLEADRFLPKYPLELYPAAARFMAEVADDFRKKLEN
jgi:sugar phosphate isomerase/epimerase